MNLEELAASGVLVKNPLEDGNYQKLTKAGAAMLPIEASAKQKILTTIDSFVPPEIRQYPQIDLQLACSLTKDQAGCPYPVPRFAVFSLFIATGDCSVRVITYWNRPEGHMLRRSTGCTYQAAHTETWPYSMPIYNGYGQKIAELMKQRPPSYFMGDKYSQQMQMALSLKNSFTGVLPDAVRQKAVDLHAAKTFQDMFLVCEAETWAYEHTVSAIPRDPLLVGLHKKHFYLIDKFDATPAEEYIAKEFTSRCKETRSSGPRC